MRFSTLEQWLHWQEGLHPKSIDLGLERPGELLKRLKLNTPKHLTITVAGTNGKGSTVALLESILIAAGYGVGSYTSPHLLKYNERIKINGLPVADDLICDAFDELDQARKELSLTYFEFGTLAAFSIFQKQEVDVALLEVGLGGRLDAVNLLDADLAIITAIDIDHSAWLGTNREAIAIEKAGIMRKAIPVICSDPMPPQSLIDYAEEIGAELELLGVDFSYEIAPDGSWTLKHGEQVIEKLFRPNLAGLMQYQNSCGAIAGLQALGNRVNISVTDIQSGLQQASLPGRFQKLSDDPVVIVDVAHNPQSATILAENLNNLPCSGKRYAVVAMLTDKDQPETLKPLAGLFERWMVAGLNVERGDNGDSLASAIDAELSEALERFNSVESAYRRACELATIGDQIIVFGSFFTVSDILGLESLQLERKAN
ncbi:MAG: bifunctional tetrahydrofolate synthase/dihydrofolate synthase [Gammaproteobacteria bacterium]|nr:bifunctional tetrahydrofolate synthase/dihydrofolate synthase [Gammaproteobacteria bacterium]